MHAKSIGVCAKDDQRGAIIGGMGTTLLETTGARLKWARMRQKKTQKGLGLEVGVRDVYISQLESGTYSGSRALHRDPVVCIRTGPAPPGRFFVARRYAKFIAQNAKLALDIIYIFCYT